MRDQDFSSSTVAVTPQRHIDSDRSERDAERAHKEQLAKIEADARVLETKYGNPAYWKHLTARWRPILSILLLVAHIIWPDTVTLPAAGIGWVTTAGTKVMDYFSKAPP